MPYSSGRAHALLAFLLLLNIINFIGIAGGSWAAGALSDTFVTLEFAQPLTWGIFIPNMMGIVAILFYGSAAAAFGKSMRLLEEKA